ncbi:MAG: ferrous iron transport protein A [Phycisphaerales bacterium]
MPTAAPAQTKTPGETSLASLRRGETGVVVAVRARDDDVVMLESMGLRPNAWVRVCRTGRTCVVAADEPGGCPCRLGIERRLAECVFVSAGGV